MLACTAGGCARACTNDTAGVAGRAAVLFDGLGVGHIFGAHGGGAWWWTGGFRQIWRACLGQEGPTGAQIRCAAGVAELARDPATSLAPEPLLAQPSSFPAPPRLREMAPAAGIDTAHIKETALKDLLDLLEGVSVFSMPSGWPMCARAPG